MIRRLLIPIQRGFTAYLLKNSRIVNADDSQCGDVLIYAGKVANVSTSISHATATVIDCTGKMVIPGGIDTHTHLYLEFMGTFAKDDFNYGTKAALAGGTTSFIDFIIPDQGYSLQKGYEKWRKRADPKVNCDYGLHCALREWTPQTAAYMKQMVYQGVTSFKFFMAYNNSLRIDDLAMFKAFECARDLGAICLVHAYNGDIIQMNQYKLLKKGIIGPEGHCLSRPPSVEAEAVHRAITIAEHANCPIYIVHLMSKEASEYVCRAKNRGLLVYSETLAATLGSDGSKLWDKDYDIASQYVMSPSLNPDPQVKTQIMKYIGSGVIDVVSTDNCTFCLEQKRRYNFTKIPNGVNGIEDRLSIVWTKGVKSGLLTYNQFVEATSTRAAQIFNMYPQKGVIRVGADADLVIWDPDCERVISCKTHKQNIDYNIFYGQKVFGRADYTFSRGNLVWDGKQFLNQNLGKFINRIPFGYVYRRHSLWTEANDPLNFKVERNSTTISSSTRTISDNNEVTILSYKITKLYQYKKYLQTLLQKNYAKAEKDFNNERQLIDTFYIIKKYLPSEAFNSVRQILYGPYAEEIPLSNATTSAAKSLNLYVKQFRIKCEKYELRYRRIVNIGAIQNMIVLPTTYPVATQKKALIDRIKKIIEVAALEKVNVIGLQYIWTAPFFMCTRERYPWLYFAETIDGESTQMLCSLAKKHNMVIVSSILYRQATKYTLHNTAVVIDNHGDILGTQEKGHIPRVGDFNYSTYYMEGETGHPVFETEFGKIAINICYGRHHPLHWMAFGLNGAEIVFNPSATVNGLSEPLWGIYARNAAVANHYFTVAINRVGTEVYPNSFTSGDKKEAHRYFGHFYGSSYIAAPDGSRTPSLSRTSDGLLLTYVDLNMCRQIKDKWGFMMTGRHKIYAYLLAKFSSANFIPQRIKNTKSYK